MSLKRKRSRCASGSGYTPSFSIGFWVASTRNGSGIGKVLAADRHVPLRHHLQQRRLHLGRRAVDLVGEHEVRHHRAELDVELLPALAVDAGAEDVGGHQVRGELDAGEGAADHAGERLDRQRLGHAGHTLEQQVALGQQADQHPLDQPVLADDHPLDLVDGSLQRVHLRGEPAIALRRRSSRGCGLRTRVTGSPTWPRKSSGALRRPTW